MNRYLRLKSGEAHRITGLGAGGTTRIAKITYVLHSNIYGSRSEGGFRGGAELLKSDALLSLTGLYHEYTSKCVIIS